jgi:molybdopterin synthase sulfur carrier subunit
MSQVSLTGSLRSAVDGAEVIEIEAETIRELMTKIVERYPKMVQHLNSGIAVAINGEIYRDNWEVKIPVDAEVFLLPRIQGG